MRPPTLAMATYVKDTLRRALRSPAFWVLLGIGLATAWAGLNLGVLALGEAGRKAPVLLLATAQTAAALTSLWILSRMLGQDETAELAIAADCTEPGRAGRFLGRAAGAALAGFLVGTGSLIPFQGGMLAEAPAISMYFTIIVSAALAAAWGGLLAALGGSALVLPGGLCLWLAGHLPWGTVALLPGRVGHALNTLLPGPVPVHALAQRLPSAALVTLGLVALVIATAAFVPGRSAPARRSTNRG